MSVVTLVSDDNVQFTVPVLVGSMCEVVKDAITYNMPNPTTFVCFGVPAVHLEKILDFCKHYMGCNNQIPDVTMHDLEARELSDLGTTKWQLDFLRIYGDSLVDLILAATYLRVEPLLKLLWAKLTVEVCTTLLTYNKLRKFVDSLHVLRLLDNVTTNARMQHHLDHIAYWAVCSFSEQHQITFNRAIRLSKNSDDLQCNLWDHELCLLPASPRLLDDLAMHAIGDGHLACLGWLHCHGCQWNQRYMGFEAAKCGNLSGLQFLHYHKCPMNSATLQFAMPHFKCVRFLTECVGIRNDSTLQYASGTGNLAYIRYLLRHGYHVDGACLEAAAYVGHVDCLHHLRAQLDPATRQVPKLTEIAAGRGNLECLRYLYGVGYTFSAHDANEAAANGQIDCLQYLHLMLIKCSKHTFYLAARNHQIGAMRWLIRHYSRICSNEALNACVGSTECVKFLVDECGVKNTEPAIRFAIDANNLEVLQILIAKQHVFSAKVTNHAVSTGRLECLKILRSSGYPFPTYVSQAAMGEECRACVAYVKEWREKLVSKRKVPMVLNINVPTTWQRGPSCKREAPTGPNTDTPPAQKRRRLSSNEKTSAVTVTVRL